MTKLMLDLETLSLKDTAAILSIGAVLFNNEEIIDNFYVSVNLQSCIDKGMTIDESTLQFWLSQPEEARSIAFEKGVSIEDAVESVTEWLYLDNRIDSIDEVWANGNKNFIWLKNAFNSVNVNFESSICEYYKERDLRTAKAILPIVTIKDELIAHHTMYAARWQANYLIKALKEYN